MPAHSKSDVTVSRVVPACSGCGACMRGWNTWNLEGCAEGCED